MADAPEPRSTPAAALPVRRASGTPLAATIAVLTTLLGFVLLAWGILYVTKGRFLKASFERLATRSSERQVAVAGDFQFYFNPINIKFRAEGITVSNPEWASRDNFFEARLIDTTVATVPLIFGTQRANWLELAGARIDAEWNADGRNTWTFGDPNTPGKPFDMPQIRRAQIAGTELRYRDPKLQLRADVRFDPIRASDTRFASTIGFRGTGSMRAEAFQLSGKLSSPNETLAGGVNRFELAARARRTSIDIAGTLPGFTQLEGSDLKVRASGANLADLFGLIGVVTPDTRRYQLASNLTKAGEEWRFTSLRGGFGDSDLAGRMTISLPKGRLFVDADIASRKVDIVDIGPFIGYDPQALATTGVQAAVAQTGGTPRLLPDAPLRAEALEVFDAHVDYRVATIRAPKLPVSNVALTFDLDRKLLKLSPLTMDVAGGKLAADISINARTPAVVTEYDIRLAPTPMGRLLAGFGVDQSGTTGTVGARIQMKGTGDSLRDSLATSDGRIAIVLPRGTFWTRNIQLAEFDIGVFVQKMFQDKLKAPVQVNCGLIAFTVRNGVAAADPILIDTSKNVMAAKGGFSFRDESLDLGFQADAKKFSLFSGQAPVGINGYFAKPGIQIISPQLLTRAGAGLGLALVASPLAAVLAFVDLGDAKDTACGPVLSGARASAQRTTKGEKPKEVGKVAENRARAR